MHNTPRSPVVRFRITTDANAVRVTGWLTLSAGRITSTGTQFWARTLPSITYVAPTWTQCSDVAPDGTATCAQQKSWGQCNQPWMKQAIPTQWGYCAVCVDCSETCFHMSELVSVSHMRLPGRELYKSCLGTWQAHVSSPMMHGMCMSVQYCLLNTTVLACSILLYLLAQYYSICLLNTAVLLDIYLVHTQATCGRCSVSGRKLLGLTTPEGGAVVFNTTQSQTTHLGQGKIVHAKQDVMDTEQHAAEQDVMDTEQPAAEAVLVTREVQDGDVQAYYPGDSEAWEEFLAFVAKSNVTGGGDAARYGQRGTVGA